MNSKKIVLATLNLQFFLNVLFAQQTTWERILQFTDVCELKKVSETSDNGYVAVGNSRIGSDNKMFWIKFSQYGDTLWTRHFNENVNQVYHGYWIEETWDKGYIIAGGGPGILGDAYLLKTDSLGNVIWYKTYNVFNDLDQGRCVKDLQDKGYVLLCRAANSFSENQFLVRTDSLGNTIWSKVYPGAPGEIQIINNSGFIVAATKDNKVFLLRLNNSGDTLWSKSYPQYISSNAHSIDLTSDGGFIIGGLCDSLNNGDKKSYVLKTDALGNLQWSKQYNTNFNEWCFSIRTVSSSKYVMCGMSDSLYQSFERAFVRLIDGGGNMLLEKFYRGGGGKIQNSFYSVEKATDNGFILSGFTYIGSGRGYVVKTDSMLNVKPVGIINHSGYIPTIELYQNYPNPFNGSTIVKYSVKKTQKIKLTLYDISGKKMYKLYDGIKNQGFYEFKLNPVDFYLSSGVYFLNLSSEAQNEEHLNKKLLYLK